MLKSAESKRSKSRSSSSSHRGAATASCLSSAFTFDGIGTGDFQLDNVGADQSEITDLLETLQRHDGAALMSDLTDGSCMPFDSLDSFSFGFGSGAGLGQETVRQPRDADGVLGSQNNDGLSNFDAANSQSSGVSGE